MVRLTGNVAPPEPLDVANTTASEYEPTDRLFALMETVMFVLLPPARVPLVAERVSQ